jgi:hypothetical protein
MPTDPGSVEITGREANVRTLRELYAAAEDGERPRAALLLALAISDLTGRLPADDPRLSTFAQEALALFAGCDTSTQAPATIAEVERSRALLHRHLSPPEAADPAPAAVAEPEPARLRWVPEGLRWNGRTVDPQQFRQATEFARMASAALPEGHERPVAL